MRFHDLNLGYALNPNITAALIYKSATIKNPTTNSAANLVGSIDEQNIAAWLLGFSGRASIAQNTSIYGNAAFGPGKIKSKSASLGDDENDLTYSIGEVGAVYQIPSITFGAVSVKLGYRVQVVNVKDIPQLTFSSSSPVTLLSRQTYQIQSITQGISVGVSIAF